MTELDKLLGRGRPDELEEVLEPPPAQERPEFPTAPAALTEDDLWRITLNGEIILDRLQPEELVELGRFLIDAMRLGESAPHVRFHIAETTTGNVIGLVQRKGHFTPPIANPKIGNVLTALGIDDHLAGKPFKDDYE